MELRNDGRIGRNRTQGTKTNVSKIVNPLNLLTSAWTLIEGFQDAADWQNWGNAAATNDTAHFRVGSQGVKFTGVADSSSLGVKVVNLNLSAVTSITAVFYIESQAVLDYLDYGTTRLYFSNDGDLANTFVFWLNADHRLSPGYNVIRFLKSECTAEGSASWSSAITRLGVRFASFAEGAAVITFCGIYADQENVPKVIITADDGDVTVYSEMYSYLQTKGLRFTAFVNGANVGNAGKATLAQLQEIYDAGNDIGNHTWDHTDLTSVSLEVATTKITSMCDWMITQGFTRGIEHLAYPYGLYTADLITALPSMGIKTGRLANAIAWPYTYPPVDNLYLLNVGNPSATNTLSTIQGYVDNAVARKGTLILLFHQLVSAGPVDEEWTISDFQDLVDYIIAKPVEVVTMSEWYAQITNVRRRNVGVGG